MSRVEVTASRDQTPAAVRDCHDLLAWIIPVLDQFPRLRRFTLGERIETGLLAVLEDLVAAAYSRDKRALLISANRRLQVVRHLWRLCCCRMNWSDGSMNQAPTACLPSTSVSPAPSRRRRFETASCIMR